MGGPERGLERRRGAARRGLLARLGAGIAAAMALGLLAAACQSGTLPDGEVRFEDVSLPTPLPVEREPVVDRPAPGLSPRMVATGFMRAMSTLDPEVVGPWLTTRGRERVQSWSTASKAQVYSGFSLVEWTEGGGSAEAVVRVERRGALVGGGEWLPGSGDGELVLRMEREAGEWRVAQPPAVPLVADADFRRLFARATVYFVTAGGEYLSPQPILLRARPAGGAGSQDGGRGAIASVSAVVERLLEGPKGEGAEALRTAIPAGTELRGVDLVDGVAKVDLSAPFASQDGPSGRLRVGQVVWTVSQLFGVPEVELRVDGQPLGRLGPDGFDASGAWHFSRPPLDGLRPSRGGSDGTVLFTRDGQLNRIGAGVTDGVPVVVPFAPVGVVKAPTWSPDASRIAFLVHTAVGDTLWIGSADGGQAVRVELSGRLSEPSWAPDGSRVLVLRAESPPGSASTAVALWSYRLDGQGGQPERLTLSPLPGGLQPTVLRVGPDGAAVLAVGARPGRGFRFGGGGQLYRGWLTASGVTGWSPAPIAPGFGTVYSPVWAANNQVAFIAKHHGHGDPGSIWSMAADGWRPERVELSPDQVVTIGDRLTTDPRGDRFLFTVHSREGATEIFSIQRQNVASLRRLARADLVTVDTDPSLASR